MATDIASLQITVDSAQARNADDALDDLAISAKRADDAVEDLGNTSQKTGAKQKALAATTGAASGNMGNFSKKAGAAGIQIQQLVGQIQGGQNAMQAFSMQAADLGIVLGAPLVGVIVSLGAVLAGTLVTSLFGAKEEAEDLRKEIDWLSISISDLTEAQKTFAAFSLLDQAKESRTAIAELQSEISALENRLSLSAAALGRFADEGRYTDEQIQQSTEHYTEQAVAIAELNFKLAEEEKKLSIVNDRLAELNGQAATENTAQQASIGQLIDGYSQYYQMRLKANELIAQDNLLREQQEAEANARIAEGYTQYYLMRIRAAALEQEDYEQAQRDRQLQGYTEYYQARADAEIEAQKRSNDAAAKLEKDKQDTKRNLQSAFTVFMESENKALFEIGKVGAASSAMINAHEAATKALTLGPILGPAAAGVMYAAGVAQVSNIMSRKFGDTSAKGSPNIPDIPTQTGGDTIQNTQTTINIAGDVSQPVFDQLQDLFDNDAVIIRPNTAQARALRA